MLGRYGALNIPLEARVEDGSILVREINPLDFYPDELLDMLREDVQKNKAQIVKLDKDAGLLFKPLSPAALLREVRRVLDIK